MAATTTGPGEAEMEVGRAWGREFERNVRDVMARHAARGSGDGGGSGGVGGGGAAHSHFEAMAEAAVNPAASLPCPPPTSSSTREGYSAAPEFSYKYLSSRGSSSSGSISSGSIRSGDLDDVVVAAVMPQGAAARPTGGTAITSEVRVTSTLSGRGLATRALAAAAAAVPRRRRVVRGASAAAARGVPTATLAPTGWNWNPSPSAEASGGAVPGAPPSAVTFAFGVPAATAAPAPTPTATAASAPAAPASAAPAAPAPVATAALAPAPGAAPHQHQLQQAAAGPVERTASVEDMVGRLWRLGRTPSQAEFEQFFSNIAQVGSQQNPAAVAAQAQAAGASNVPGNIAAQRLEASVNAQLQAMWQRERQRELHQEFQREGDQREREAEQRDAQEATAAAVAQHPASTPPSFGFGGGASSSAAPPPASTSPFGFGGGYSSSAAPTFSFAAAAATAPAPSPLTIPLTLPAWWTTPPSRGVPAFGNDRAAYAPTRVGERDLIPTGLPYCMLQHVCAAQDYINKSPEELRLEAFRRRMQWKRLGAAAAAPIGGGSSASSGAFTTFGGAVIADRSFTSSTIGGIHMGWTFTDRSAAITTWRTDDAGFGFGGGAAATRVEAAEKLAADATARMRWAPVQVEFS